jgi:hypothetical protein
MAALAPVQKCQELVYRSVNPTSMGARFARAVDGYGRGGGGSPCNDGAGWASGLAPPTIHSRKDRSLSMGSSPVARSVTQNLTEVPGAYIKRLPMG